ncbi:MAG TPA: hypothetical protein VK209_09845, partial [Candidatus Sulfotelmatobacter sp.]|nr:hypothetical protein [Candidatus Sulfotelmatobacter sp.]
KGTITFALGGLVLAFVLFFTSRADSLNSILSGFVLMFIACLFIGLGLWGIIQDATTSRAK